MLWSWTIISWIFKVGQPLIIDPLIRLLPAFCPVVKRENAPLLETALWTLMSVFLSVGLSVCLLYFPPSLSLIVICYIFSIWEWSVSEDGSILVKLCKNRVIMDRFEDFVIIFWYNFLFMNKYRFLDTCDKYDNETCSEDTAMWNPAVDVTGWTDGCKRVWKSELWWCSDIKNYG